MVLKVKLARLLPGLNLGGTGDFEYRPLPSATHARFFILEPGRADDPLVGKLRVMRLSDAPKFEAISYVWGSPEMVSTVKCGRRRIRITENLESALRRLRLRDASRVLWADGICINQRDRTEKGHQVAIMGIIFSEAERVLICVGNDPRDDAEAVRAMTLAVDVSTMVRREVAQLATAGYPIDSFSWPEEDNPFLRDDRWHSISILSEQPWWDRGWVVQEAGLARSAKVLWGTTAEIDWLMLQETLLWCARRGGYKLRQQQGPFPFGLHFDCYLHGNQNTAKTMVNATYETSILTRMDLARSLALTDERDRIYAFLALAQHLSQRSLDIVPDYSRPVLGVYYDFALNYLRLFRDLTLLNYVEHTRASLEDRWASWVPRWDISMTTTTLHSSTSRKMRPRNSEDEEGSFRTDFTTRKLHANGVIIDTVQLSTRVATDEGEVASASAKLWNLTGDMQTSNPYPPEMTHVAFVCALTNNNVPNRKLGGVDRAAFLREVAEAGATFTGASLDDVHKLQGPLPPSHYTKNEIESACNGRNFIMTKRGYFGLGPRQAAPGDLICVIFGCPTSFVIRKTDNEGTYKLVGPGSLIGKSLANATVRPENSMDSVFQFFPYLGTEYSKDWEKWDVEEQEIILS